MKTKKKEIAVTQTSDLNTRESSSPSKVNTTQNVNTTENKEKISKGKKD